MKKCPPPHVAVPITSLSVPSRVPCLLADDGWTCSQRRRSWGGGGGGVAPMKILGWQTYRLPPNFFIFISTTWKICNARIDLISTVRHYNTIKFNIKILLNIIQFSILRRAPRAQFYIATLRASLLLPPPPSPPPHPKNGPLPVPCPFLLVSINLTFLIAAVEVHMDKDTSANPYDVTGGGLTGTFRAYQFHFHFGSNEWRGSEHTVNGKHYPAEVHFLFSIYAVKVRRHTPWSRVRCHGPHECWFTLCQFHSRFHSRRHSLRITLKYTTLVHMRSGYAWTMKSWQRSEWTFGL